MSSIRSAQFRDDGKLPDGECRYDYATSERSEVIAVPMRYLLDDAVRS